MKKIETTAHFCVKYHLSFYLGLQNSRKTKNPDNFLSGFFCGTSSPETSGEPRTHGLKIVFGNYITQNLRVLDNLLNKYFALHTLDKFFKQKRLIS